MEGWDWIAYPCNISCSRFGNPYRFSCRRYLSLRTFRVTIALAASTFLTTGSWILHPAIMALSVTSSSATIPPSLTHPSSRVRWVSDPRSRKHPLSFPPLLPSKHPHHEGAHSKEPQPHSPTSDILPALPTPRNPYLQLPTSIPSKPHTSSNEPASASNPTKPTLHQARIPHKVTADHPSAPPHPPTTTPTPPPPPPPPPPPWLPRPRVSTP